MQKEKDDTLILLTSDHGESLTEHEIFFDHHGLYDVTTHVPLILFAPKHFPNPKRIKALVQHVDLVPTLCDLMGVEAEGGAWDGLSLLPMILGYKEEIRDHTPHQPFSDAREEKKIRKKFKSLGYMD